MADDKDIEGEEGGAGGGKKKLLLIVAVVLVLLLGGGAAAFFMLGGGDEGDGDAAADATEEAAAPVEEGEPTYIEMKPVFVVNLPEGGPAGMLQLGLSIYTRNAEVKDYIANNDPMLRHYIIDLLEQQPSATLMTLKGKKKLQTAIQDLISAKLKEHKQPGEVKGVYFTQFVLQ
jgi:flagellar protein FliL